MPKKFAGENTKAIVAKQKKLKAKQELILKEDAEKSLSDRLDAFTEKKINKNKQKEQKRQDQLNRKNELKELLKKESAIISKAKYSDPNKLSRQEIEKRMANRLPLKKAEVTASLTENLNELFLEEEIARTIDAAISLLNDDRSVPDKHPEKRLKAGHKAFEEKRLKELKVTHPTLKLSQLKQMAFKEWQKCSQNL